MYVHECILVEISSVCKCILVHADLAFMMLMGMAARHQDVLNM